MDKVIITGGGLDLLERIVRSCPPEPTNGGMDGKKCLLEMVQEGGDVDFEKFLEKLNLSGSKYNVFSHIWETAQKKGAFRIDESFVAWYFGGPAHIKRAGEFVASQIFPESLGNNYAERSIVSHILLPVTITEIFPAGVSAVYRNHGVVVPMQNLLPFAEEKGRMRVDSFALCHHSSLVKPEADGQMVQMLLKEQAKSADFIKSCIAIRGDGINHARMMSYPWAKRVFTEPS